MKLLKEILFFVHQELLHSEVLNGIIIDGDKFISETLLHIKILILKKLLKVSIQ
jgi:hypothetical protein